MSSSVNEATKRIQNLFKSSDLCISVELCPNRSFDPRLLDELSPRFCSVACLGHSPSATMMAEELTMKGHNVLLHVTGRNHTNYEICNILQRAKRMNIKNILALQGDPVFVKETDDSKCHFPHAIDLVKFVKKTFGDYFNICVAGYPEKHPNSLSQDADLYYLKRKVDTGANFIITQAFFEYEKFANFKKQCDVRGINVPIIPGVLIISSYKSLASVRSFCKVSIPAAIQKIVEENKNNTEAVKEYGTHLATNLIKRLLGENANFKAVHIFSLNNLELSREVLRRLGLLGTTIARPIQLPARS